ncbi:MAG: TRAP transporter substrate-binding protein [Alphaproteobacteria bacterium]
MKRRDFIAAGAVAGVAAAASSLPKPAIAQERRDVKLVTTWPKNFPGLGTGAQRFADRVTAMTEGRLTVQLFAAGELVPPFESFDAVSAGNADMYHGAAYYWQGKAPAFNFFAAVPFGLLANEMNAWIYHLGGQELWDELAGQFNVKCMMCGNTGVQMGGWFNKEINSLDDLQGLTIRMPGLGGEVLRRIGANAVALPGGEIYPALESGAIDATEWVGPWNDLAFGFYKVTQYYYYPGFHEPGTALDLGINVDFWNSLSETDQAIVRAAAAAENVEMLAEFDARNADALKTLLDEHGVELKKFSNDVLNAIGEASGAVVKEVGEGGDELTKRIYDSFMAARGTGIAWTKLSSSAFSDARLLPFPY